MEHSQSIWAMALDGLSPLLWAPYYHSPYLQALLREIARFAALDPAQARWEMGLRLLAQLRYFGGRADALPEWREAAGVRDPEELWRLWPSLPILTKTDLRQRYDPQELQSRFGLRGVVSSTGGSTGEPTPYLHDARMIRAGRSAKLYALRKMGWRPGLPTICVWGSERDIGKQRSRRKRVLAALQNLWLVDGYKLDEQTLRLVMAIVARHPAVAIYGFTSMLEFIAEEALRAGDRRGIGRVRAAWNGGEMLHARQSALFQRAFGVPILDFYGGRELSAMAFQPAPGASLQVLRPGLFLEIVDERGKAVAANESGRLVFTSTACRGTPFLRFDVGDLACWRPEDCDESGVKAIGELQGRSAGLLRLADGRTINNLFWNHLFKEYQQEVTQFQVAIVEDRRILLRLRGTPFLPQREEQLRRTLRGFLGDMPVAIAWVQRLPRTREGKLVQVVRE
jgi:phenylacetate-CoA ligase